MRAHAAKLSRDRLCRTLPVSAAVLASFAALGACSSAGSASSGPPPLAGHAAHPAPTTPAPRIAWRDGAFDTSQLPAIARDASLAVVPDIDSDGGRGYPNLQLEVRERGDFLMSTIAVMSPNDYDALVPDGAHPAPELERRIAAANATLAELHANHDLVTMQPLSPSEGIRVTFGEDHTLRVMTKIERGDFKTVAKVNGTGWLAKPGQRCAQCEPCENPAFLDGVYKAPHVDAVVVRINYRGTDTCWEPGAQLHVVAW